MKTIMTLNSNMHSSDLIKNYKIPSVVSLDVLSLIKFYADRMMKFIVIIPRHSG